ncbi:hypothetical protein MASR1M60_00520 [Rhodocyclaceae bacterium]
MEPATGDRSPIDESAENLSPDVELNTVLPGLSKELGKLLILLALTFGIFALFYFTPLGALVSDIQKLRTVLAGDDLWAEATYLVLVTGLTGIGMPRLMFYALGGLAFGFSEGFVLAQVGALAGSFFTFRIVRAGGRGWLVDRYGDHRLVNKLLRVRSSVKSVVLIRQLPISGVMINSGLALGQVSDRVFLVGSFIGFLPQGLIACLIGSGVADDQAIEGFKKLVAAGVAIMLGIFALRYWKDRKTSARIGS